jgi:hypothetical protein
MERSVVWDAREVEAARRNAEHVRLLLEKLKRVRRAMGSIDNDNEPPRQPA